MLLTPWGREGNLIQRSRSAIRCPKDGLVIKSKLHLLRCAHGAVHLIAVHALRGQLLDHRALEHPLQQVVGPVHELSLDHIEGRSVQGTRALIFKPLLLRDVLRDRDVARVL